MTERGGLVMNSASGPVFVPAAVASQVVQLGAITSVPGLPAPALGVALAEGRVVVVISIGVPGERSTGPAIVCDVDGEAVAFVGGAMLAVGAFEADGTGVRHGGAHVPELDARGLYAELEGTLWAARALELAKRRAGKETDRDQA